MPVISTFGVNYYPIYLGKLIYTNFDQGWLEYYGSQNIHNYLKTSSFIFQFIFNNNLKIYLILLVI